MSLKTPVALIFFNRPQHLSKIFARVREQRPEHLFLIADGPREHKPEDVKLCAEARALVAGDLIDWPCTVIRDYSDINQGCKDRIVSGLTHLFKVHEEAIILEDDCLPDPTFFPYASELLERYRNDPTVALISGTRYPGLAPAPDGESYQFTTHPNIWGWAAWRRTWEGYDPAIAAWGKTLQTEQLDRMLAPLNPEKEPWNDLLRKMLAYQFNRVHRTDFSTWDYQLLYRIMSRQEKCVIPATNLVVNLGFGDNATNTQTLPPAANPSAISLALPLTHPARITIDVEMERSLARCYWLGQDLLNPDAACWGVPGNVLHPLRISVVTPSYNQGKFLGHTMRSILSQDDPNLQYVVVDGGSKDESPEIIRRHADRLAWWVSEKDKGHADAINKGFARTDGEIMAWLNSDDMYCPWTFAVVREIFEKFPDVEWISGIPCVWSSDGQLANVHQETMHINKWDYMAGRYGWIQQEATFWRRSLWEKAGGRMDDSGILMIDGELWTRFFKHAELWRVNTVLAGYRMHGTNRAHEEGGTRMYSEMKRFCDRLRSEQTLEEADTMSEYMELCRRNNGEPVFHPCSIHSIIDWHGVDARWQKTESYRPYKWPCPPFISSKLDPTWAAQAMACGIPLSPETPVALSEMDLLAATYRMYRQKWHKAKKENSAWILLPKVWLYRMVSKSAERKIARQGMSLDSIPAKTPSECLEELYAYHNKTLKRKRRKNRLLGNISPKTWMLHAIRKDLKQAIKNQGNS